MSWCPSSRLKIIDDAGHLPTLEQPEATNEALLVMAKRTAGDESGSGSNQNLINKSLTPRMPVRVWLGLKGHESCDSGLLSERRVYGVAPRCVWGENMATVYESSIDNEQINGAFALAVDVRFDDLSAGTGQKVFDFNNGDGVDNIWLGQVDGTNDMEFVIVKDGIEYRIVAENAIVEGEYATWRVGVDPDGVMRIAKNSEVCSLKMPARFRRTWIG